jgi:hypothetical protein
MSEKEKRQQELLKRHRRENILMLSGVIVIAGSVLLAIIPSAVAAYSGMVQVAMPWDDYLGIIFVFGLFLLLAGIISRISPDMMEGDALWIFKLGPFDKGR